MYVYVYVCVYSCMCVCICMYVCVSMYPVYIVYSTQYPKEVHCVPRKVLKCCTQVPFVL